MFTEVPEGPGNDWLWVILNFVVRSPRAFIVCCLMHPRGANDAFGFFF